MKLTTRPTKTLTQEIEGLLYTWGRRCIRPGDLKKTIKNNHERWMKYKAKGDHVRQRKYEIRTLVLSSIWWTKKSRRDPAKTNRLIKRARALARGAIQPEKTPEGEEIREIPSLQYEVEWLVDHHLFPSRYPGAVKNRITPLETLRDMIETSLGRFNSFREKGDPRQRRYAARTLALSYVYQKRQRAYTRAEELLAQARAVAADTDAGKDVPIQTNPTIPHLREKGFTNE